MINGVASGPSVGDPQDRRGEDGKDQARRRARPPPEGRPRQAGPARDLRLLVDTDPNSGALSYRWIDRDSGEVVDAISREDLPRISGDPFYVAGDWLDTSA